MWKALPWLALVGCQPGTIGDLSGPDSPVGANPFDIPSARSPAPILPASMPRVMRLTHAQWQASVVDNLGLGPTAPDFTAGFVDDPRQGGYLFGNNIDGLQVEQAQWDAYRRAAETVAATVVPDEQAVNNIVGSPQPSEAEVRTYISSTGALFHRRFLSQAEADRYYAIYTAGTLNPLDTPASVGGLRLLLES